jgi:hypothetical protein
VSGVIVDGQQWEHCNCCGKFVRFPQNLGYEKPSEFNNNRSRDICVKCVDTGIRAGDIDFDDIVPADEWKVYTE